MPLAALYIVVEDPDVPDVIRRIHFGIFGKIPLCKIGLVLEHSPIFAKDLRVPGHFTRI